MEQSVAGQPGKVSEKVGILEERKIKVNDVDPEVLKSK